MLSLANLAFSDLAIIGTLVAGIGGALVAIFKVGPERTGVVIGYQAQALNDLQSENRRLIRENAGLRERLVSVEGMHREDQRRITELERRLGMIEAAGHGHPGHPDGD